MTALPVGWSEADWNALARAERTAPEDRSDDDWEILDRPRVWSDPVEAAIDDGEIYSLGAGATIDPED